MSFLTNDPLRQKTILLVDDEPAVNALHCRVLGRAGYQCITALDGRAALNFLRAGLIPDAILLDWLMPLLDGEGFLNEKNKDPRFREIPTLVVTSFLHPADIGGVHKVLLKPVPFPTLVRAVEEAAGPGGLVLDRPHSGQRM